ncbi:MAG: biopolymer transport protein TolR [Candidatus Tokpelaia sp. JSC161]|jgi:biopolymer transport protein TolR|nr:MAG: biopolymer transport protein TolR [Candidatus Tokpelaia sp. JSC161]
MARRRGGRALIGEINVAPLVDVMLVLLIIFMVSAPLVVHGVPIDLPETSAGTLDMSPLTVSLAEDGRIAISGDYYSADEFIARLKMLGCVKQRVILRAAKAINYGQVLKILSLIQQSGFTNVGLASLPLPE